MKTLGALLVIAAGLARAQLLTPVWVELGDEGKVLARVVVQAPADCPSIQLDGSAARMILRTPVPAGMRPACELAIPAGTKKAAVNGKPLPLPRANPSKIVVLGDTGCRVKGERIQDCNDPAQWPLPSVARRAASEKPSLVVHVGDYLYRETKCPEAQRAICGSVAPGDHWETWNADFFAPAAPLLAAAPWAFSRGNHEDCSRSWKGWFYYLDPRPWTGVCEKYTPAYLVTLGRFQLAMLDSSAADDRKVDPKQVAEYASELASLHAVNAWLVDHHPFWGLKTSEDGAPGPPAVLTGCLAAAWDLARPPGIHLVVSGHTHLFELLGYDHGRPAQLIAGDGGTKLSGPLPKSLAGTQINGATVVAGATEHEFGYTLFQRKGHGWKLALKGPERGTIVRCTVQGNQTACKAKRHG